MAIKNTQRGFTLLIAVIFMSVMLSLGLALGSLAFKQEVLASSAIESQYAFYAADAGLECALYADQGPHEQIFDYPATDPGPAPSSTAAPSFTCDGGSPYSSREVSYTTGGNAQWVLTYRFNLDSSTPNPRCVDVTVYKSGGNGSDYIFSQGYDVPCGTIANGGRVVSRGINIKY